MEPELLFAERCIEFTEIVLMCENNSLYCCCCCFFCVFSVLLLTLVDTVHIQLWVLILKLFNDNYCMDEGNVNTTWK